MNAEQRLMNAWASVEMDTSVDDVVDNIDFDPPENQKTNGKKHRFTNIPATFYPLTGKDRLVKENGKYTKEFVFKPERSLEQHEKHVRLMTLRAEKTGSALKPVKQTRQYSDRELDDVRSFILNVIDQRKTIIHKRER